MRFERVQKRDTRVSAEVTVFCFDSKGVASKVHYSPVHYIKVEEPLLCRTHLYHSSLKDRATDAKKLLFA